MSSIELVKNIKKISGRNKFYLSYNSASFPRHLQKILYNPNNETEPEWRNHSVQLAFETLGQVNGEIKHKKHGFDCYLMGSKHQNS